MAEAHPTEPAPSMPPASRPRAALFGLQFDALTLDETVALVDRLIDGGGVHLEVSVNVDKVVKASRDPALRDVINSSDIVCADGQPIVWASKLLGQPLPERVAGIDLMQRLIAHAAETGRRLYFLGAREEILERVVARVRAEHPTAAIAGWRNGYWASDEEEAVARSVAATRPDIVFLAIPSPAKEMFLDRWKDLIGAGYVMGVGGSFDVYAGEVPRAPQALQRLGLEWLHRLAQEPKRMWRRYLVEDMQFLPIVARAWWRSRRRRRAGDAGSGPRRLRILVVTNLYPSPTSPAFGTFIAARVQGLRTAGALVHVCAIRDAGVHHRRLVKYLGLAASTLSTGARLAAQRRRLSVVEAHIAFPTGWIAWPIARIHRAPLVLFVHGADVGDIARRSTVHSRLARGLFRRADQIVVNSEFMAGKLSGLVELPEGRVIVRSPGIDVQLFGEPGPSDPDGRSGLLFVGRLHSTKGLAVLLQALGEISRRQPVPALTVIGDGPERRALEATASADGLRVTFLGAQPPAAVAAAMRACAVLVMPSTYEEPLGLVAIEGMAAGAIVVASHTGGLAETVVDGVTGVSVEPGDTASLADGIERALHLSSDPVAREGLLARARQVASAHGIDAVARQSVADVRGLIPPAC